MKSTLRIPCAFHLTSSEELSSTRGVWVDGCAGPLPAQEGSEEVWHDCFSGALVETGVGRFSLSMLFLEYLLHAEGPSTFGPFADS